jgi:Leucine-rich repeat (LRR) protein
MIYFFARHLLQVANDGHLLMFISFNQLEALPESLQNLDSLTYLYAHNNKLVIFPEWIPNHKNTERRIVIVQLSLTQLA